MYTLLLGSDLDYIKTPDVSTHTVKHLKFKLQSDIIDMFMIKMYQAV